MGFKYTASDGKIYYLNYVIDKEGPAYFISRDERPETACDLPEGYEIVEARNGVPVLKKKH